MQKTQSLVNRKVGKYKLVKNIGGGSFGEVYMALNVDTFGLFAIKELDKFKISGSKQMLAMLMREVNIMSTVDHKNVIKLYEFLETEDKYYIVMDYCEEGKDTYTYIGWAYLKSFGFVEN